jgi:hypothetical protein
MRRAWLGLMLLLLSLSPGFAQRGSVLRESEPAEQPAPAELPPDNSVTATPLPPPDQEMQPDDGGNAQPPLILYPPQEPDPGQVPNGQVPNGQVPNGQAPGSGKQAQPQGQPQRGGWVQMGTATLQALDKVNARNETLMVKVGDVAHFGTLDIAVRGCFVRSPDRPADATAFLVIRDQRADGPAFTGWMVRSAPYMSMLAHPLYDVRVTGCS